MKQVKATELLPEKLVLEIQKYIQGASLYIPKQPGSYCKWGAKSGGRKAIDQRNAMIRAEFSNGKPIDQLANEYFLATETIKKIVYSKTR
jgi:Mor family transcriptional regulator